MTVLVIVGAVGETDPDARVMIRLMHRLIEALDERTPPAPDVRHVPDAEAPRPQ
jgi:hypothetical protein